MPMPVKVHETDFPGVLIVETGCFFDERGFFSESYSKPVWDNAGFKRVFVQDNLSMSKKGTMRGLHYQINPHGMGKLVRVVSGAIFDVGIDLRKGSPMFGKWYGRKLTGENKLSVWFPAGFAHGFVALADDSIVLYKCDETHRPECERAIRYSDPQIGIRWPMMPTIVSKKDSGAPLFAEAEMNFTYQVG